MRSFYCLYGDTVNTAARMCKLSDGAVRASADFVTAVSAAVHRRCVVFESRGRQEVKGKGLMETYDVRLLQTGPTDDSSSPSDENAYNDRRPSCAPASSRLRLSPSESASAVPIASAEPKRPKQPGPAVLHAEQPVRLYRRVLRDPELEARFAEQAVEEGRVRLAIGLVLHVVALLIQWWRTDFPEYSYDFAALGAPMMAARWRTAAIIVEAHAAASAAASLALIIAVLLPKLGGARAASLEHTWCVNVVGQNSQRPRASHCWLSHFNQLSPFFDVASSMGQGMMG